MPLLLQATGLTWDASSRTLLVSTPQGAPRVLTSLAPAKPAAAGNSSSRGVAVNSSGAANSSTAVPSADPEPAPGSAPARGREAAPVSSGGGAGDVVRPLLALLPLLLNVLLRLA